MARPGSGKEKPRTFAEGPMKAFFQRYATPSVAGLFLVSLISGIGLFFHFGPGAFHGMHEWLSMALIVPFGLHLWKNWRAVTLYFSGTPLVIACAASLALAAIFFAPVGGENGGDGPPQFALVRTLAANSPAKFAPLLGLSGDDLVAKLKAAGFSAAAIDLPLTDIAKQSAMDDFALAAALAKAKP